MKYEKIKIGQKLKIKKFEKRPRHWNVRGKMDEWMDKIVTIRFYTHNKLYVKENDWIWQISDFSNINCLPNELFEI